jgi:hypothetical protein
MVALADTLPCSNANRACTHQASKARMSHWAELPPALEGLRSGAAVTCSRALTVGGAKQKAGTAAVLSSD